MAPVDSNPEGSLTPSLALAVELILGKLLSLSVPWSPHQDGNNSTYVQ